jgi:hypothetical protein
LPRQVKITFTNSGKGKMLTFEGNEYGEKSFTYTEKRGVLILTPIREARNGKPVAKPNLTPIKLWITWKGKDRFTIRRIENDKSVGPADIVIKAD